MIVAAMVPIQQMAGKDGLPSSPGIPPGLRVYAIGDLHGRFDLLCRLHRLIAADVTWRAPETAVLVYLGDYVDRGPASFELIDSLINEPLPGFERAFLKGNHEAMLLDFLDGGEMSETWLMNGGIETLASYGIDLPLFDAGPARVAAARQEFRRVLAGAHLTFFEGLELYRVIGGYVFVHAGLRPEVPLDCQDERDLLWVRPHTWEPEGPQERIVVHGHTITPEPEVTPARIGIDTGAWRSGRLTGLVLEGTERRFLHT